ncbi:MAG: hypothetical protein FJ145_13315 [Deltaproteobacteria bacterium]|nr:hypothetical protein [Deltaproteobacteria bacterium]
MTFRTSENTAEAFTIAENDSLAPYEFYATFKRSHYAEPEKRLMAALLEDAVTCLTFNQPRYSRRQQKEFAAAHAWVNAQEDGDWVFSFVNVCETLGMDPSYLRGGLNEWAKLQHQKIFDTRRTRSKPDPGLRHKQIRLRAVY